MFRGQYIRTLKDGRIKIPTAFRPFLTKKLVIHTGENIKHCVAVLENKEPPIYAICNPSKYTYKTEITLCDDGHTLILPDKIIQVSGLEDGKILLIGTLKEFEIWNTETWETESTDIHF